MSIAAIYARKSNDNPKIPDELKSVTGQIAGAREYAAEQGWIIAEDHIYTDDGISGALFGKNKQGKDNRPGLARLLNALSPRPPFDILVMSEESRPGRESIETSYVVKQIVDAGVRPFYFFAKQGERKLNNALDKVQLSLINFAAEMEREKAVQRAFDASRRRAQAGLVTGGASTYGYTNYRDSGGVKRVVNDVEADIVRRIFTMYAAGSGYKRIANRLNEEGVPAPKGGCGSWSQSVVRDMLHRDLYRGVMVWGKSQKVIDKGSHGRLWRDKSALIEMPMPELQTVNDDLWDRVQARLGVAKDSYIRITGGKLSGSPSGMDRESPYLLSGIARCAECGGSLIAITHPSNGQKRRIPHYGCLRHHKRGVAGCKNNVKVRAEILDEAVMDVLIQALDPEIVAAAVRGAVGEMASSQSDVATRRTAITTELADISKRERRLLDALVDGDATAGSIRDRLRVELARRDALQRDLVVLDETKPIDVDALVADIQQRAGDLRGAMRRNVVQARQIVRLMLDEGQLVCTPVEKGYEFKALGTYKGLTNAGQTWWGNTPKLRLTFPVAGIAA